MGGNWATIRFYQGTLIINAPDFVHRQIGGYPYPTAPIRTSRIPGRRYVTFGGGISHIEIIQPIRPNIGIGTDSVTSEAGAKSGDGAKKDSKE